MTPGEQLSAGVAELGVCVNAEVQSKLLNYLALLSKWNRTHNLTAIRDTRKMVSAHLLDCLAILPFLQQSSVLDVGTGPGLPGLPLALSWPAMPVLMVDGNHKKAAFVRQAIMELGLRNGDVTCARVEEWRPKQTFGLVISRALADISEFIRLAGRFCAPGGALAAMKGLYPREELSRLPPGWRVEAVHALRVPGLNAERHLVMLVPAG